MSIQNQEEHIGHVKQSKSDRFQDSFFLYQAKYGCTQIFPKNENLTLTVVFMYSYVISLSCTFCIDKTTKRRHKNPCGFKIIKCLSSINKMKLCFNLKDTMYFLRFLPSPGQMWW